MKVISYKSELSNASEEYRKLTNKYPRGYRLSVPQKDKFRMKYLKKKIDILTCWLAMEWSLPMTDNII